MENKKIRLIWKIFSFVGIFAAAGFLYFFVATGDGSVLKTGSTIAMDSWSEVFGGTPQPETSDEVDLDPSSSSISTAPAPPAVQIFSSGKTNVPTDDSASDAGDGSENSVAAATGGDLNNDEPQPLPQPLAQATATGTAKAEDGAAKIPVPACAFADRSTVASVGSTTAVAPREIILNEIAWMGSLPQDGETGAKASEREWVELKNISSAAVDVSGWQVLDSLGNVKIILADGTDIPADGFYLFVRGGDSLPGVQTDAGYSGALPNTGDKLAVFNTDCGISDFLDASAGWPAGNNTTKQTLERDADGVGWHSSALPGGTPRAENSVPIAALPASSASSSIATSPASTANSNVVATSEQYLVSVSMIGAGVGTVSSSPAGILCGFDCEASYAAGTKITFAAEPAAGSLFKVWSGACAGSGTCSFTVSSSVSLVAEFDVIETSLSPTPTSTDQDSSAASSTGAPPAASFGHLVIAAVQIAGASSSNDFVKMFNPTAAAIDISGWKLHKKSNTGTDYSVRTFPAGSVVSAGGYFVWANSLDGFSDSIGADASSTETLSADNSAALFDANGNTIDQVAWGTGTDQYVEGAAYPTDPIANQVLTRKFSNGTIVDTGNNAVDFAIQ